ncbi:TAP-like protein [Azospirillum sp. RU38E]|nr:TAP-like protein [Azospirillum sp. RU38E]SNT09063.1 TAP-like protein [Azospirillum sp. RU37A]
MKHSLARYALVLGGIITMMGMIAFGLTMLYKPRPRTSLVPVPVVRLSPPVPTWVACPPSLSGDPAARCLRLAVPGDWQSPSSPRIDLFATLYPALEPGREDPLLVVLGGPGQAGSDHADRLAKSLAASRASRDLIFFDQRGSGLSRPSLACKGIDPWHYWYGTITARDALSCLEPIRAAGFRLENFDTAQSAHDLQALRVALGIRQWNILATSYGAIAAQALLRLDGNAVRSVIFNSPGLPGTTWLDKDRFEAIRSAMLLAVSDCKAQPACARTFPNLDGIVERLATAWTRTPLTITLSTGRDARAIHAVEWHDIANLLAAHVGSGNGPATTPRLLDYLARLDPRAGDAALTRTVLMPPALWRVFDELSYGLNLAIGCREERPHIDASALRAAAAPFHPYAVADAVETDFDAACPALMLEPAPADFYRPVTSAVPALILTGVYDTYVPSSRADTLATRFPNAQVFRFRGLGHDVLGASPCGAGMVAAFLVNPVRTLDFPCLDRVLPPRFVLQPLGG